MNYLTYILPFMNLFKKNSDFSEVLEESKKAIRQTLHEEVLLLSVKVFSGLIITAIIVTSLVFIGQQLNLFILNQENGPYVSIAVFGVIAAVGIGTLIYLFKPAANKNANLKDLKQKPVDLQNTLAAFLEGLEEGIKSSKQVGQKNPDGSLDVSTETLVTSVPLTQKQTDSIYKSTISA